MNTNKSIRILSYNVGSNSHLSGLTQLLDIYSPNFVFLQEISICNDQLNGYLGYKYEGICNRNPDSPGNQELPAYGLNLIRWMLLMLFRHAFKR